MKTLALLVVAALGFGCDVFASEPWLEKLRSTEEIHEALLTVTDDDPDVRRVAAAEACIFLLKTNGVWRVESHNWKIPSEDGIRAEAKYVRKSKQTPDLAIANMAAHCMGSLPSGAWRKASVGEPDATEKRVLDALKKSKDPAAKALLLVGLASSSTEDARDTIVAATLDPDLGVRKVANYLVQRCSANSFGPIGVIHIGSPEKDVELSGERIRKMYETDKSLIGDVYK